MKQRQGQGHGRVTSSTPPPPCYSPHSTHPQPQYASMHQELEEDPNGSYLHTLRDMDLFVEDAIRTIVEIEERAKDFKQRLLQLQMRRHDFKRQYSDRHPREEAAAEAEPPVQASTVNDERPGQTHHKFRLCFNGSLKSTIYTNKPLLGQSNGDGGIEITIRMDDRIITSGRLASLKVEIVALEKEHTCKGEWTGDDFDRQIRKSRDGQGSVLEGECVVELVNGKASLGNIRFKEGSTGTRSREFVLGARICKSENMRVEEAFMHPPFVVLVERSKGNEKSPFPKLTDKVYTLKSIGRNGQYAKRLENANILTVEGFLKALNKDRDKLHQILQIKMEPAWDAMVKHAMECDLSDKPGLRAYKVESKDVSLFFNCVDGLVGAEFTSDGFVATKMFSSAQKAFVDAQLEQAHRKLNSIPVDYVLENDHPVKILMNVAPGSSHQETLQAASNLRPDSGINCATAPWNPLGDANLNPAGQSSSELLCHVGGNGHSNQDLGQDDMPWNVILENVSQNISDNQATFQASENTRPLGSVMDCVPALHFGDANCNAARHSASEPLRPDHCNGLVNKGPNCITDPEGGVILPDSPIAPVDGHINVDETFYSLIDDFMQQETNNNPVFSPGGNIAAAILYQRDNGSEAPNDVSFWLETSG